MSDMVAKVLLRAAELVEMGHCKDVLALDAVGVETAPENAHAVAWCVVGAIVRASHEVGKHQALVPFMAHHGFDVKGMLDWNNAPERTADEVAAALRAAAGAR